MITNISGLAHRKPGYRSRQVVGIKAVVVHHTAAGEQSAEEIAKFHVESRGFPGIGYHYLIHRGGAVEKVNAVRTVSFHCGEWNRRAVGVAVVGNLERGLATDRQWGVLVELVTELCRAFGVGAAQVVGHREVPGARTLCPGRNMDMERLRKEVVELMAVCNEGEVG